MSSSAARGAVARHHALALGPTRRLAACGARLKPDVRRLFPNAMNYDLINLASVPVVECKSPLSSVNEAAELVSACAERNTDRLLLDASVLPPSFFELPTCFAGEFLQKLQNYHLRTAVVISPVIDYGARFDEYLLDAKRARFSRLFSSREEALAWLALE